MDTSVKAAVKAFETVSGVSKAQKAFDFIAQYKAETGHRPSLSSIVMLWQDAEDKLNGNMTMSELDELTAKVRQ